MKLHRRQFQVGCDVLIFNLDGLLKLHAFENFCGVGTARDGRAAAKCLKHGFIDSASLLVDLNLQLHDVATGWRAN